jgi:hypothetical protein
LLIGSLPLGISPLDTEYDAANNESNNDNENHPRVPKVEEIIAA